jgi:hypothetical protein
MRGGSRRFKPESKSDPFLRQKCRTKIKAIAQNRRYFCLIGIFFSEKGF